MDSKTSKILLHIKQESDPIIKARLIHLLHTDQKIRIVDLAKHLEYTQTHVCNLLRLMKLPVLILDGFYADLVSYTHLLLLSRLKEQNDMIRLYEQILQQSISTSQLEEKVRMILTGVQSDGTKADSSLQKRIEKVFKHIDDSLSVKITQTRVTSRIVIDMKGSNAQTTKILEKIAELS